jgi:hypothetical protein
MSVWLLVQVTINLALILGLFSLWNKFRKSKEQEDPRLSRGLQLLQSKISILEDLSDRTEVQVKQLTALLNGKAKEIHDKLEEAEKHVRSVDKSIERSMEVSKIFQDKIPHQEIIERQTTARYIEAARLAHRGIEIDEISKIVDIPRGELELIVRMNRQQMVMSETEIPAWAKKEDFKIEFTEPLEAPLPPKTNTENDFADIRERLLAQSLESFNVPESQEINSNAEKPTSTAKTAAATMSTRPTATPAPTGIDIAAQILEEQLKSEKFPITRSSGLSRKSSIVQPGSAEIKAYEFKRVKVTK